MKTRHALPCLLIALAAVQTGGAPAASTADEAKPEFTVVVVDSLRGNSSEEDIFNRIDRVFTDVFNGRKWPYKITVERFAANTAPHPTELRVFFHGIREESMGDLTFSAWMILYDHGRKEDFGVIRFRYDTRPGEQMDDRLDRAVRGAARLVASKIEPILIQKQGNPRP